ncbi:MAG: hypothetical protein Fur0027_14600 [Raineya sp.]
MVEFEINFGNSFKGLEALSKLIEGVGKTFDAAQAKVTKFFTKLQQPIDWQGLGQTQVQLNNFAQNIQRSSDAIMGFMSPGIAFEQKMAELSAGTGVVGKELQAMGQQARKLAVDLGLPADQIADVYLQNLSKLSPELAKTAEGQKALADMAKTTALLSKGMGGDLAGATDALTTMMNAYNIDMSKPEEAARKMAMIGDMLTVSFKEGAIDVAPLAAAMKTLGASGAAANVSLAETLGTLQVLGQKGAKVGAEGGTAMRNALAQLAQGELMPKQTLELLKAAGVNISALTDKTKSFAERMEALKPIMKNDAIMSEFFGKENLVAGQAILQNLDQIREATAKTQQATGANAEYAGVAMNTTQGVLDRMKSAFNDLAISAFDALKPYVPMISLTSQMAVGISSILPLFATMGNLLKAGTAGLMQYGLGLNFTSGALQFQKASLLGGIVSLARWAGSLVVSGLSSLATFTAGLLTSTTGVYAFNAALLANPIGIIVAGIAAVGVALWGLYELFSNFGTEIWKFVDDNFIAPFKKVGHFIDELFGTNIMGSLKSFFSWIGEKIGWLWDKIKGLGEILGFTAAEVSKKEAQVAKPIYDDEALKAALPKGVDLGSIDKSSFTDIFGAGSEMSKLPDISKGKDKTQKGLGGVAGGGAKATNITINLQKLQDKIEVHSVNLKEGVKDIEKQLTEMFLRVLNSTNQYSV